MKIIIINGIKFEILKSRNKKSKRFNDIKNITIKADKEFNNINTNEKVVILFKHRIYDYIDNITFDSDLMILTFDIIR